MSDRTPTRDPRVTHIAEYHQAAMPGVPPEVQPPTNVDVPYIEQVGETLTCTMGNWTGEPTTYTYNWSLDGVLMTPPANPYIVTVDDVGKTATCVVSVSNAAGGATAPPSNAIVVESPT